MTCTVWVCVWITVSLMGSMVGGKHDQRQARNMPPAQIEIAGLPQAASGDDTDVVADFQRRLCRYDAVRRQLDASLPVQAVSSNPADILAIIEAHHTALWSARQTARQGDMFSPRIAALFRSWIHDSLHGLTAEEFLVMITEDDALPIGPLSVNASYPHGGSLTTMPPALLQILPTLPPGLEYKFLDRDLILWDSHANLIVDVIPQVLVR
jgi:hypothetical protein